MYFQCIWLIKFEVDNIHLRGQLAASCRCDINLDSARYVLSNNMPEAYDVPETNPILQCGDEML